MFFIQRPVSRFPQHTYRLDYYQQSSEEQYYRDLAEEHSRRADLALRLAQQERQRALRERELRSIRARQYQEQLARRSPWAPQPYHNPDSAPAFDLVLSFANEPPRSYSTHPVRQPQPSETQDCTSRRRPTSFFEHLLQTLDVSPEHENERAGNRVRVPNQCQCRRPSGTNTCFKHVRFGPEQAASATHTRPAKQDKGKGRAAVQEEPTRRQRQEVPQSANPASSFWNLFGGLQALEEEDAVVRQLNLFGERSYPRVPQQGVAGPSGTRHPKPSGSASSSTAKPSIPVPINTTGSSPSTPSSVASSPKSHAESFTSLDAIQSRFDALKSTFVFPDTPQFESATETSSGAPRLSYSPSNTSVHEYENELTKLLTKLDAVDSDGAESIRGARKALVVAVEKELDKLDEEKKTAWRNSIVGADVPAAASESNSLAETSSEPRRAASEVESTWIAPISAAAGEEVRGYDVFEPTVEQPVPASTREEPESTEASRSHENPIAPSDSIAEVEVADPAPKEELETPAPVVEAPEERFRDSALEAPGQALTPQAQPYDSDSQSEVETTELAGVQEHSDTEAEPFVDVQQASPLVSEASLEEFETAAPVEEATKEPLKDLHASDDEFEML